MKRAIGPEILDSCTIPEHIVDRAYRDLRRLHRIMGDTRAIVRMIRSDPLRVRRILDIGCARGGVSRDVQRALQVEVIGVDLVTPRTNHSPVPIIRADAVHDSLPKADVAYCMHVAHHLSESELIAMIRNVGCSCRRFIILDLVRHRVPLILFRTFVAPFFSEIAVNDGALSVRRSYCPHELRDLVTNALDDSGATVRHLVAPFWVRQIVDISWPQCGMEWQDHSQAKSAGQS